MQNKAIEPRVVHLLRCIEKSPELYIQHCKYISRGVKQKIWDHIAKTCGFVKTEDAKCRWRGLVVYFRHLLEAVAKKKLRRYIPNTGNPDDKFVHLSDWCYYEYIKFMVPFMNIQLMPDQSGEKLVDSNVQKRLEEISPSITFTPIPAITEVDSNESKSLVSPPEHKQPVILKPVDFQQFAKVSATPIASFTPTPLPSLTLEHKKNPIKLKIGEVIVEIQVDNKTKETHVSVKNQLKPEDAEEIKNTTTITAISLKNQTPVKFTELSDNDKNLKTFFDAMLKSTQKLPKYHQERVKRKLLNSIRDNKKC